MQSILCIESSLTCEERHKTAPCELKTKKAPIMATDDNMDMGFLVVVWVWFGFGFVFLLLFVAVTVE